MKRITLLCCILTAVGIYVLLYSGCSLDYAGGTGGGNPGTKVSIVADTGAERSKDNREYDTPLPIQDESLVLYAHSAQIVVQRINFILDDSEKNDSLLSTYTGPLTILDDSVFLEGPFLFNALNGSCEPPFDTVTLPEAKYKGLKLAILNNDSAFMEGYSILFSGDFVLDDEKHNFSIKLSNEDDIKPFLLEGPPVLINEDDSTEFRVTLNANHWLDYMDLKVDYLDDGTITFDPISGDLNIDKSVDANIYKDFNKAVRLNIMKSGSLQILFHQF